LNPQRHRCDNRKCRQLTLLSFTGFGGSIATCFLCRPCKEVPDPLNCHKYYLRIDDQFYNLTCPNTL